MGSWFLTCNIGYPLESWKWGERVGGWKTLETTDIIFNFKLQ